MTDPRLTQPQPMSAERKTQLGYCRDRNPLHHAACACGACAVADLLAEVDRLSAETDDLKAKLRAEQVGHDAVVASLSAENERLRGDTAAWLVAWRIGDDDAVQEAGVALAAALAAEPERAADVTPQPPAKPLAMGTTVTAESRPYQTGRVISREADGRLDVGWVLDGDPSGRPSSYSHHWPSELRIVGRATGVSEDPQPPADEQESWDCEHGRAFWGSGCPECGAS